MRTTSPKENMFMIFKRLILCNLKRLILIFWRKYNEMLEWKIIYILEETNIRIEHLKR